MRRDHAEAHAVLQRVAKAIYEQTEEPTRLFGDEIDPDVALELDLLDSGTDGVAFSNPDVRRDYLVRHTAELALGAWDDPVAFTNIIDDAQYRTLDFGTRREVTTVVLLVLARDHDKDVVGRMGEVARLSSEARTVTTYSGACTTRSARRCQNSLSSPTSWPTRSKRCSRPHPTT